MNREEALHVLQTIELRKRIKQAFGELFECGADARRKRMGRAVVHELIARELGEVVNNAFVHNVKVVLANHMVRATASRGKQYYSGVTVRRLADREELQDAYSQHDSTVRDQIGFEHEVKLRPGVKAGIDQFDKDRRGDSGDE